VLFDGHGDFSFWTYDFPGSFFVIPGSKPFLLEPVTTEMLKLSAQRAGLPGDELSFLTVPLGPV